jgi:hypothetical protein
VISVTVTIFELQDGFKLAIYTVKPLTLPDKLVTLYALNLLVSYTCSTKAPEASSVAYIKVVAYTSFFFYSL